MFTTTKHYDYATPRTYKYLIFFRFQRIEKVKNFLLLVELFLQKQTCCLSKCASFSSDVQYQSNYKKLLRFFSMKNSEAFGEGISALILCTVVEFLKQENTFYFALDRTNWKIGKHNINPLFIGIIIGSFFVPLCWIPLDKKGNSNTEERIKLVDILMCKLIKLIKFKDYNRSFVIIGDREFVGEEWFDYLGKNGIHFVMRLRINMYQNLIANKLKKDPKKVLKYIEKQVNEKGFFVISIYINEKKYYYIALPNTQKGSQDSSPFCCFISDKKNAKWVQNTYQKRWKIEVFFKDCKTNGFHLEEMNLVQMGKVELMLGVVSFAYVLCMREGQIAEEIQAIPIKVDRKRGKKWKSESTFRLGLREMERLVSLKNNLVNHIIKLLAYIFQLPELKLYNPC